MADRPITAEATMATTSTSYFGDVHATVLRQHAEIRARLRGLDAGATPVAAPLATVFMRVSLLRLASLLDAHLLFEELELAPHIRELDAWGPAREAAMLAEHVEQRARLQQVCAAAEGAAADDLELAHQASSLVVSLLEDMAREEHHLLEVQWLDEHGADQMTG
jgi:hypothetical protein